MRHIKQGDIVYVFVSQESSIYHLVNHWPAPAHERESRPFKVLNTPADSGDLWYLEGWIGHEGINIAVNQTSADFDAFVKALDAKDAQDKLDRIARERPQISVDKMREAQ